MKKVWISIVALVVVLAVVFALKGGISGKTYRDGTYEGAYESSDGQRTSVTLTIKDNKIVDCKLNARDALGNVKDENYGKGGTAEDFRRAQLSVREMKKYPDMLLETQDIDKMDALSGATVTFKAMQIAVHEALKKAR